MATRKKMKKYTAMSVWLNVKRELAAPNGGMQFFICIKATTKKRVHEILTANGVNSTLSMLNKFNGLWENEDYPFNPPENEKIYFHNEHSGTPHFGEWLAFDEWKAF